jgi:peroxiredoxin Q/BCP
MTRIEQDTVAPDFNVPDHRGQEVRLSDYRGKKNVLLVLNRGFV